MPCPLDMAWRLIPRFVWPAWCWTECSWLVLSMNDRFGDICILYLVWSCIGFCSVTRGAQSQFRRVMFADSHPAIVLLQYVSIYPPPLGFIRKVCTMSPPPMWSVCTQASMQRLCSVMQLIEDPQFSGNRNHVLTIWRHMWLLGSVGPQLRGGPPVIYIYIYIYISRPCTSIFFNSFV